MNVTQIREAVGIFVDAEEMQSAADELLTEGFSEKSLGLLTSEDAIRKFFGDHYVEADASAVEDSSDGPRTAFVRKQSMGDALHAYAGSLFFAGATTAAGVAVASAGVLGGALLTVATGVGAIGAVGGALALIIHQSDAEYLEEHVDEGRLLLFVKTRDQAEEQKALEILSRHTDFEIKIHTVNDRQ